MAAKETSPNKSAFVRSIPSTIPASEVVNRAKAAGLKMTANYVYSVRSRTRGRADRKPKSAPTGAAPVAKAGPSPSPTSGLSGAIEAFVERKVEEILKRHFRTLLR